MVRQQDNISIARWQEFRLLDLANNINLYSSLVDLSPLSLNIFEQPECYVLYSGRSLHHHNNVRWSRYLFLHEHTLVFDGIDIGYMIYIIFLLELIHHNIFGFNMFAGAFLGVCAGRFWIAQGTIIDLAVYFRAQMGAYLVMLFVTILLTKNGKRWELFWLLNVFMSTAIDITLPRRSSSITLNAFHMQYNVWMVFALM